MSVTEGTEIPVEVLGGLVTNIDPQVLPVGTSPDCADIAFKPGIPGTVQTRPGLTRINLSIQGATYITTYIDSQGNSRNLYLDENGVLWQEFPFGTFTQFTIPLAAGLFAKSDTAFGSEFIGFSDGKYGKAIPRRFIGQLAGGATDDRVSQLGPAAGPLGFVDETVQIDTISRTATIVGDTTENAITDVVTTSPHNLTEGELVTISGVDPSSFDGTYIVNSIISPTEFTYWNESGVLYNIVLNRTAGVVTVTLPEDVGILPGQFVYIVNPADTSFNGEFTITGGSGNTFTYNQAGIDKNSAGGTLYWLFPWGGNVQSIVVSGGIATVTYSVTVPVSPPGDYLPSPVLVGQTIILDGILGDMSLNGIQTVTAVISDTSLQFSTGAGDETLGTQGTIQIYMPTDSGTGGIVGEAGDIDAGTHQCTVLFITRNGYFTAPAPPVTFTASGQNRITVTGIPIGPPNVIARLLMFTAVNGASFFFSQSNQTQISSFLIPDNTTTSWTVNFSDLALLSAENGDLLFDRIELPEVAGFLQFSDRMAAWGARNRVENFLNMSFAGGVRALGDYPLGWFVDPVGGTGGSTEDSTVFGFEYVINGGGSAGNRGMITQDAYQDYLGVAILSPSTNYSLRQTLRLSAGGLSGNYIVDIYSASGGGVLSTASISLSALTTTDEEYIFDFDTITPATIPADTVIRLYVNFTASTAESVIVNNGEIFPTLQPFSSSVLYMSNAADPEAFQGVTGFLEINENDGNRLVAPFIVRDRFYILKSKAGMFSTTDDPSNEPSGWTVDTISRRIGAETINCAGGKIGDTGEDWTFITAREGLYVFWSSEPPKVSQEIQPTWDMINWDYAYTMWISVDTRRRRTMIGVPLGNVTTPNKILVLDWQQVGATGEAVASGAPVAPNYAGAIKAHTTARKWTIWNIPATAGKPVQTADGSEQTVIAKSAGIYQSDENALTDDGEPIPGGGYYITAYYPSREQQQAFQMKGNRSLLRYITLQVVGIGDLEIEEFGPGFVNSENLPISGAPPLTLSNPAQQDMETYANFSAERIALKVTASDDVSPWWSMEDMSMYIGQDPVSTIRGYN